eukprot:gene10121-11155_t
MNKGRSCHFDTSSVIDINCNYLSLRNHHWIATHHARLRMQNARLRLPRHQESIVEILLLHTVDSEHTSIHIESGMNGDKNRTNPAGGGFSWVPPRSTVVNVFPKTKTRNGEQTAQIRTTRTYFAPPAYISKPVGNIQKEVVKVGLDNPKRQYRERSQSGRQIVKDESPRSENLQNVGPDASIINLKRSELAEKEDLPIDVITNQKIAKDTSFNVEHVLASRKISQFNPSQKFLSFSYQSDQSQNGDDYEGSFSKGDGAVYAKRLPSPIGKLENGGQKKSNNYVIEQRRDGAAIKKQKNNKSKGKGKSVALLKERPIESEIQTKEVVGVQESNNPTYQNQHVSQSISEEREFPGPSKRKSVFEMNELQDEAIDINDLLSRKISQESQNDNFVSISYESPLPVRKSNVLASTNPSSGRHVMHGGMYARKIKKQGQEENPGTNSTSRPEINAADARINTKNQCGDAKRQEKRNENTHSSGCVYNKGGIDPVVRQRKTSKFVNSSVGRDESFDVDELLSQRRRRKESEQLNGGSKKFISISWQRDESISNDLTREGGGIYAKRV